MSFADVWKWSSETLYVLIMMHWTCTISVNFQRTIHGFRTQNAGFPAQHLSQLSWQPWSWCSQGSHVPAPLPPTELTIMNLEISRLSEPHWVPVILAILEALLYDFCLLPSGLLLNNSCKADWILVNLLFWSWSVVGSSIIISAFFRISCILS